MHASAAGHRQVGGASIRPVEGRRPRASRVDHGGFVACGHGQVKFRDRSHELFYYSSQRLGCLWSR